MPPAAAQAGDEVEDMAAVGQNRLYQAVARRLIGSIASGRYAVGQRLPAERELAAEFSVSRPTVREAIIALEVQGLVEVRVGSGVYVKRSPKARDEPGAGVGAFELTEARLLFEGEAAALAATVMSDGELDRLDALVAQIEEENRRGMNGELPDREFHMAIARGTGNEAVVRTIESLWNLRSSSPECAVLFARARSGGSKPVVEEHSAIVAALRSREPARARAAMRAHLSAVITHLLETTEAEAVERARAAVATTRTRFARSSAL